MRPEIKVFIQALRAGKPGAQAYREYCWARSVVPITRDALERWGDPSKCSPVWQGMMAAARGVDAFDEGGSDDQIAAEFEVGLAWDHAEQGVMFRPATKAEQPSQGQLLRAMSIDDQMKAAEILGVGYVARSIATG